MWNGIFLFVLPHRFLDGYRHVLSFSQFHVLKICTVQYCIDTKTLHYFLPNFMCKAHNFFTYGRELKYVRIVPVRTYV